MRSIFIIATAFSTTFSTLSFSQTHYTNFKVAVYARAYETQKMGDMAYVEPIWNEITTQVKVDKIYLETHRDLLIVDQPTLDKAKNFFQKRGVELAGGITLTVNERNRFETFCYSKPEHRQKVKEIVEHTARNFDEIILDDFFFTNCKCQNCINEKGDKSWTEYRLALLSETAESLIIAPAKAANPDVKVVIKYPNWYEHFQGLGFNLETGPQLFDGLYTGTETRDAVFSHQHLQPYHGYLIFRFFETLKPGENGGGWVDTGGMRYVDRYAEQLALTLFAKAPEITLFDFRQLQRPLTESHRGAWAAEGTSFSYDEIMAPFEDASGKIIEPTTIARAAGYVFEKLDAFLGQLGNPVGLRSYKPLHSTGEDFLQNFLGMAGIPVLLTSSFPEEDSLTLLTESAKFDEDIVGKIKNQLTNGKSVVITSGLLEALQGRGIEDIVELRVAGRKALVEDFMVGRGDLVKSDTPILIPQVNYLTNDAWELVSAIDGPNGWPLLLKANYGKGVLYVLTTPDNFADLYRLPVTALNEIRKELAVRAYARLEGPAEASIFLYDNNTLIVQSFSDEETEVTLVAPEDINNVRDLISGETIDGRLRQPEPSWFIVPEKREMAFAFTLKPHSFKVFELGSR